jgi:hypothetical protein
MRSTILMSGVAAAALAMPAFAAPDRYDQGYSCSGGAQCVQQQMRLEDGNRSMEKSHESVGDRDGTIGGGKTDSRSISAERTGDGDDEIGDEVGDAADDVGDEVSDAADEAGDEIDDAADEVGDAIGDAFD